MSVDLAETDAPGLIARVRGLLTQPQAEWEGIARDNTPIGRLTISYLLPLAAAGVAAAAIGSLLMTGFFLNGGVLAAMLAGAAVQSAAIVAGVLAWGFVINALAPSFDSRRDLGKALRLAIYAATPVLVAALSLLLPVLAFLVLVAGAIYAGMLLYHGLPILLGTPQEKRAAYALSGVGIALVGSFVFAMLYANLADRLRPEHSYAYDQNSQAPQSAAESGLEALQSRAAALQSDRRPVDPARAEAQLPPSLPGGFLLQSATSSATEAAAEAVGVYASGEAELRVTVVQAGAGDTFANLARQMAAAQQQNRGGYSRIQTIQGRIYAERVDMDARSVNYGVIGRGVAILVAGVNGVTLDQARAAVEIIDMQRLEREFGA